MFSITNKIKIKSLFCSVCGRSRKFEKPKTYIVEKQFFLLFAVSARMKMKKYLKGKS